MFQRWQVTAVQDEVPEEHYKDSTQILQMLRDHLTQWTEWLLEFDGLSTSTGEE